jgi:hypothetical protein
MPTEGDRDYWARVMQGCGTKGILVAGRIHVRNPTRSTSLATGRLFGLVDLMEL